MSRKKAPIPSWEQPKGKDQIHSPAGVDALRKSVKAALKKKYATIIEGRWRWDLKDPRLADMARMSQGTAPEKLLFQSGKGVWLELFGQFHYLAYTAIGGINLYGFPVQWHPIPAGWEEEKRGENVILDEIADMVLDDSNSVIMRANLFGNSDSDFVDSMVALLVDNMLTLNQLQLLSKSPYIFRVTPENRLAAQNFYLALSQDKPMIVIGQDGEDPSPYVEMTQVKIDPTLLELLDKWECELLESFGIPAVPITKRAQQTVSEVQSNDSMLKIIRDQHLRERQRACDRLKELFNLDISVTSVIDELMEEMSVRDNGSFEEREDMKDEPI